MTPVKINPAVRLLPSLTDVAFLMPVLMLFFRLDGAKQLLGDGDTGWHIRTGEWILANGRVPDRDLFSFSRPGEPWFAWEWLSDVIFGWLHREAGMNAVVLFSILLLCLTSALLFRLTLRACGNPLIAIAVTFLATAGSSIHWLARPHLFTLLFLVVFCSLLARAAEGRTRLLLWLPALTVLWTQLHGGFFVGIVVVGTYAAGEIFAGLMAASAEERSAALRRSRPYFLALLGCAAATFVNPYFYGLHVHIVKYLRDPYHFRVISEFMSISFQHPAARYFEIMIVLGGATAMWSLYKRRFTHAFLIAGWVHLALMSARNIPLFLIVAAPAVALALAEGLAILREAKLATWARMACAKLQDTSARVAAMERLPRLHLVSAGLMAGLALAFYQPAPGKAFEATYDSERYPDQALTALAGRIPGPIFTHDEWGDYLIYRLYPDTKVFVDGRSDFYGAKFGEEWLDAMNAKHGWQAHLDRYGIEMVLLPPDTPLAGAMKETRRWKPVYDDGIAIAFRAEPARGQQVSAELRDGGMSRGREAAKTDPRDPAITTTKLRSEQTL
jgi:hypothetical protein